MPGSQPAVEKCAGDELRRILNTAPDYSASALGNSLTFENYVSSGVVEVPEMALLLIRSCAPPPVDGDQH